jgi:Putative DNA-binding domain
MDPEAQNCCLTNEELARWVRTSGESDFVDAKGPMTWDGADASASLAKDIAAFANSRDGGVIVIGRSEANDGSFSYDGLSPDEAASFDTTKVGQWVNSRFAPPIRLACHQVEVGEGRFVVITVQEFDDVPSLCIKSFQDTRHSKDLPLREGTIDVRNQNAESKPMKTVDELRGIIGLATRKKGDELLAHFNAMLKGRSLANLTPTPDPFEQEIEQVQSDLKLNEERGGWWMSFRPTQHAGDRWSTPEELETLIVKHSVHIYEVFPGHQRAPFPLGWGIANDLYGETWALTKSGLFCCLKEFDENSLTAERTGYRGGDEAQRPIPPGEWVECTWAIRTVVDFFMFQSRFVDEYGPGEGVHVSFKVGPLVGRKLVALNPDIVLGYGAPEPCRAPFFTYERTTEAESLRTNWEQACAEVLKRFVGLFPNHRISQETLLKWVKKYKTRGF